jgi:hypothetical protein
VSQSSYTINRALVCLRLAAECKGIAAQVREPELRARFLQAADESTDLADRGPILH